MCSRHIFDSIYTIWLSNEIDSESIQILRWKVEVTGFLWQDEDSEAPFTFQNCIYWFLWVRISPGFFAQGHGGYS